MEEQQEHVESVHTSTGWMHKIKMWILEYKRVLTVTKKPTKEEYARVQGILFPISQNLRISPNVVC